MSRATLLFREVSTINTTFQRLSLDLERLRSDMFLAGSYVRDQLFDSESDPGERQRAIETAHNDLIQYTWRMTLVSSLLGLMVAAAAGYGNHLLQKQADQQRLRTERAERELRNLSSQLVHAQEQERRMISRELHDEVGQTLTGLGIELGNLEHLRDGPQSEFGSHLADAKRLIEETLRTVRNIAMGLRPSMLDDSGIAPAVRWQAYELSRRTGTPVDLQIEGDFDGLGDRARTCLYRVVQEALTNCARHAEATTIQISMQGKKDRVCLSIRDDGVGFDTCAVRRKAPPTTMEAASR